MLGRVSARLGNRLSNKHASTSKVKYLSGLGSVDDLSTRLAPVMVIPVGQAKPDPPFIGQTRTWISPVVKPSRRD